MRTKNYRGHSSTEYLDTSTKSAATGTTYSQFNLKKRHQLASHL